MVVKRDEGLVFFLQESPGAIKFLGANVVSNWIKEQAKGGYGMDRVDV